MVMDELVDVEGSVGYSGQTKLLYISVFDSILSVCVFVPAISRYYFHSSHTQQPKVFQVGLGTFSMVLRSRKSVFFRSCKA